MIFSNWKELNTFSLTVPGVLPTRCVVDRDGGTEDAEPIRRQPDAQDLLAAVCQLLLVHFLHRLLQGQGYWAAGGISSDIRVAARGMRAWWVSVRAICPTRYHHDRETSDEHGHGAGNAVSGLRDLEPRCSETF